MKPDPAQNPRAKRTVGWFSKMALEDGLATGGCLLCQALRRSVRQYLFSFIYEGMMSGDARGDFLKGGGFCQLHFWQAKGIEDECWPDGFGVSILCENLLSRSLKDLASSIESGSSPKAPFARFRKRAEKRSKRFDLIPGVGCIACAMLGNSEEHYLESLEELLEEPDFAGRYRQSQGICLRHLQAAVERWESSAALELARTTAEKCVRQLIGELEEFQRKHDYRFKHEHRGSEWSSPQRAIEFLVGQRFDLIAFEELRSAPKRGSPVSHHGSK